MFLLQFKELEEPLICCWQCPQTGEIPKVKDYRTKHYLLMIFLENNSCQANIGQLEWKSQKLNFNCTFGEEKRIVILNL